MGENPLLRQLNAQVSGNMPADGPALYPLVIPGEPSGEGTESRRVKATAE
jgi:hypothetical protein